MKKLPLYWKTWIITVITILATSLLFFVVLTTFTGTFLESTQDKKFQNATNEIVENIKKYGVNRDFLNNYSLQNFSVFILENDEVIYTPYLDDVMLVQEASLLTEPTSGIIVENFSTSPDKTLLTFDESIPYNNSSYKVSITYPVAFTDKDVQNIFNSIIPYFIVIGIIVASLISIFYARYFTTKIDHLNIIINHMASQDYPMIEGNLPGDEIQQLENNLNHMYIKLQQTLELLHQEMNTVKRLEKDRQLFMRGAVHELKTPMMTMSTIIDDMMTQIPEANDREEYLADCFTTIQSMTKLINDILNVSKLESIKDTGKTNLKLVVTEVLDIYEYMIKDKNIQINLTISDETNIKIPTANLQKVLSNLIGNAVKYTPYNETIDIISDNNHLTIQNVMEASTHINIEKIFQPFVSYEQHDDDEYKKGHGLGLYIVSAILNHYDYAYDCKREKDIFIFKINF